MPKLGLQLCFFSNERATVSALVTVGFSFDAEPTVNSQDELAVETSGSHNLRRRSNCNLCAFDRDSRRDAVF